ncbi:MAG: nickel pincer cofactor biosynthesis protein LarC [Candidatus Latescibacterota bacterium]|nr:MAG: nickel pincer cofactor biosynthesis protein LarC [Candidatus Latescibacterota bacterium]
MTNVLVIDPFSGTSGDMFLAALVDLGVPFEMLCETVLGVPELRDVRATRKTVKRGVIEATQIIVECPTESHHRSVSDIRKIVNGSRLEDNVKKGIIKTFDALAEAEAKVHGSDRDDVHFHEVGALDAMFDIFGAHVALELLGNPLCYTRPIVLGTGKTNSQHGEIPIPAPATLELLAGYRIKLAERDEELVTPTGAAIIASIFAPLPEDAFITPARVGYGAGTRESEGLPNILRAFVGSLERSMGHVCILTSTIDDMNPEVYGFVMEQLFAQGVLDVYCNQVMMKKNRPGVELTVITEEMDAHRIADFLMANSTTLGVRIHREERVELPRRKDKLETPYGTVTIKIADRPGGAETMSPEYESCRALAKTAGVPIIDIYEAARRAWDKKQHTG